MRPATSTRTAEGSITTMRPRKADAGHSIVRVERVYLRRGVWYASAPKVSLTCECGAVMRTTSGGFSAVLYRHNSHTAKALTKI